MMPREEFDDRTPAALVEGMAHILRSAALGAVAGHQQEGVGHPGPDLLQLLGVGGAGDRADPGIAVGTFGARAPLLNEVGHQAVDRPVLAGGLVLKLAGAGIGGLDQHEAALVLCLAGIQEGIDAVGTHIAVEGHTVGVKDLAALVPYLGGPQPGVAVSLSSGANVAPLDVSNDIETLLMGIADGFLQHGHAAPAQALIVGGLGLDRRDHVAQGVDQSLVENSQIASAAPIRFSPNSSRLALRIWGGTYSGLGSRPATVGFFHARIFS